MEWGIASHYGYAKDISSRHTNELTTVAYLQGLIVSLIKVVTLNSSSGREAENFMVEWRLPLSRCHMT